MKPLYHAIDAILFGLLAAALLFLPAGCSALSVLASDPSTLDGVLGPAPGTFDLTDERTQQGIMERLGIQVDPFIDDVERQAAQRWCDEQDPRSIWSIAFGMKSDGLPACFISIGPPNWADFYMYDLKICQPLGLRLSHVERDVIVVCREP